MKQFILFALLLASAHQACKQNKGLQHNHKDSSQIITASGLIYEIIKEGNGDYVKEGDEILINETTSYSDGTLLFTSEQLGHPLKFLVGGNMVIQGVDEGVRGMRPGEIRKMIVPPSLSHRTQYPDFISPDSTLYYEVELVDIVIK